MGSQRKMGVTPLTPKVKDLLPSIPPSLTLLPISCFHHPLLPSGQRRREREERSLFTCAIRSPDRPTDDPNNGLNNNPWLALPNPLLFCFAPEEGRM